MPVHQEGAQRASGHRILRLLVSLAIAAVFATTGLAARPAAAAAAQMKVVIVVGPVGSATSGYITSAKKLASQARSYGAKVIGAVQPARDVGPKVKSAAQGANILIYLGHGNGYPSPYGAFSAKTKDGMGLNSSDGSSSHTYYGEYYIDRDIQLAKNAVVILNRLCYASGNNEWGAGYPSKSTAIAAGRQLRCGLPAGERPGRLRRGHRQRLVHPLGPVHDQPIDDRRSAGATRPATAAGTSRSTRSGRRASRRRWTRSTVRVATTAQWSGTSA